MNASVCYDCFCLSLKLFLLTQLMHSFSLDHMTVPTLWLAMFDQMTFHHTHQLAVVLNHYSQWRSGSSKVSYKE